LNSKGLDCNRGSDTKPAAAPEATFEVNGSVRELEPGNTVADVVAWWCASPDGVAVARNREVVPRSLWALTALEAGDRLEIVTAAAGG